MRHSAVTCSSTVVILAMIGLGFGASQARADWFWANPKPNGNGLFGVCECNGVRVAVGEAGTIYTSDDHGTSWTSTTYTLGQWEGILNAVGWGEPAGGPLFVAAHDDGTTWTPQLAPVGEIGVYLRDVASNGEVAITTSNYGSSHSWAVSHDGWSWDFHDDADGVSPAPASGLVWGSGGGGRFVAVGSGGRITTSPDGVAWTEQVPASGSSLYAVCWSGGEFVAVGSGGSVRVSPDGISWMDEDPGTTNRLFGVACSAGTWVAVGDQVIATRAAGVWTTEARSETLRAAVLNGSFAAVGFDSMVLHEALFADFFEDGGTWAWTGAVP